MKGGIVAAVAPGSVAEKAGVLPQDVLLAINDHSVRDVLDVQFYAAEEELRLLLRRGDGEIVLDVDRDYRLPLGLDFTEPTFDDVRRCNNHCPFCFVAQMPPRSQGLRPSLYIRDDDYRYSVLYGNFVTMTNLTPQDWNRLQEQRLSPLYISVHATDPGLRRALLGGDPIPDILQQIDRLAELGIAMHTQVVLVPGRNDGPHLEKTVTDLAARYPAVRSIGVVPVGLTRYHRGPCRTYTPAEAAAVIAQIAPRQAAHRARHGVSLVYLADEWYLLSRTPLPADADYDDYSQIENGIGLARQFLDDWHALDLDICHPKIKRCTLVCGTLIAPLMRAIGAELTDKSGVQVDVISTVNQLFGETVTVSGLLGGQGVLAALQGRDLGEVVCLPRAMFDDAGQRTLDDLTADDLAQALGRPIITAASTSALWSALCKKEQEAAGPSAGAAS